VVIVLVVVLVPVLETHKSKNAEDENEYEDEIDCNIYPVTRNRQLDYNPKANPVYGINYRLFLA
jgi:hypothetical protein